MLDKVIDVKLKIFDKKKECPSGHLTRYAILFKEKQACSLCLANGNYDNWFENSEVVNSSHS
ncbi:hypothetical protein LCGC14_2142190 [marine sediment metagenome]|uniref:Uncharacterized protein n=1 Tax=marine sediment metagenome TaxID=412755 RepID=A0A0F9DY07_9ZZZZ